MKLKLNVEFDQEGRALSLDQFTKTLLEAVQKIVRQELNDGMPPIPLRLII